MSAATPGASYLQGALAGALTSLLGFGLAGALPWAATKLLRPELADDFAEALLELPLGVLVGVACVFGAVMGLLHVRMLMRDGVPGKPWLLLAIVRMVISMPLSMACFPLAVVGILVRKENGPRQAGLGAAVLPFLHFFRNDFVKEPKVAAAVARALTLWLPIVLLVFLALTQVATKQGTVRLTNSSSERERIARAERSMSAHPMSAPVALGFGTLSLSEYLLSLAAVRSLARRRR